MLVGSKIFIDKPQPRQLKISKSVAKGNLNANKRTNKLNELSENNFIVKFAEKNA